MCLEAWLHPYAFAKGIGKRIHVCIVSSNSAIICAAGALALVYFANLLLQWSAARAWGFYFFPNSPSSIVSDFLQFYRTNGLSAFRTLVVFISPITTVFTLTLVATKFMRGKWAFHFRDSFTIQIPFCLLVPLLYELGQTINSVTNASGFGVIVFFGIIHWIIGYSAIARYVLGLRPAIAVLIGIGCTILLLLIQFVIVSSLHRRITG